VKLREEFMEEVADAVDYGGVGGGDFGGACGFCWDTAQEILVRRRA